MDLIEKMLENEENIVNFYRRKRIDDKIFLSTDHGTWVLVTSEQYQSIVEGKIEKRLFEDLCERGIIINSSNYDKVIQDYCNRYDFLDKGASLHIIVPTIRCNLRCIYCHSEAASITEGSQYDTDEGTLKKTLEFIFKSPNKDITIEFQGGEPLLNKPIIKKTLEYSEELNKKYKKNYKLALVTNLIAMDEDFLNYLALHKDRISVCTSLDGPKEVHDMNRRFVNKDMGTYDYVTYWLKRFKEKGISIGLLMVTTKYSLPFWKEIVDEYVKWGKGEIQLKPLDYLGYAVDVWDEIGYTMNEFVDFWIKAVDYMFDLMEMGIFIGERYLTMAFKNLMYAKDVNYLDLASPCGLIRGQVVYNYNGEIYCCDEARVLEDFIIGNVFEDNYIDIINSKRSKELITESINEGHYCDSCAYKPFCGVCPVLNYAQEKNYRIKLNKTNRCQKNKAIMDYALKKLSSERKKVNSFIMGYMLNNKFGNFK